MDSMTTRRRRNHPALERAVIGLWAAIDALEEFDTDDHECVDEYCPCQDAGPMLWNLRTYLDLTLCVMHSFPEWSQRKLAEARAEGDAKNVTFYEWILERDLAERAADADEAAPATEASPTAEPQPVIANNPFYRR